MGAENSLVTYKHNRYAALITLGKSMHDAKREDRALGMDVTRAVACSMVVLLHVSAVYFHAFSPQWGESNFLDSATRCCVPLFFMLSGALLLEKEESIAQFYRRRIPRILWPLVFWTVAYLCVVGDSKVSVFTYAANYALGSYGHLWYFYSLLGLYLAAPFLGKVLRSSNDREIAILFGIWFFFACILTQLRMILLPAWDPINLYGAQFFSGYMGFFLLGAFIRKKAFIRSPKHRTVCAATFLVSTSSTAYATYLYSRHLGQPVEVFFVYTTPMVAISAISGFALLTSIDTLPKSLTSLVRWISGCSLGIYCLHPMILSYFLESLYLGDVLPASWVRIPAIWLMVLFSAAAAAYLIRKIPMARRIA